VGDNEECRAAKGKQNCSCFWAQLKFVNLLIQQQKSLNKQHLISFLMGIPKCGLQFLYLLYLKSYCEKSEKYIFNEVW